MHAELAETNAPRTHGVAIVTGASSGIGRAVSRLLAARGFRVVLVARTAAKLEQLVTELGRERATSRPLDVSDRRALTALPAEVKRHFGRLDLVINSAGVNHRGAVSHRTREELVDILETNLLAPVLLTHAALSVIEPGGAILNVASLAGKVPVPDEATYSASKAGLRAFARALDTELSLRESDIRVLTICPGPVETGFLGDDLSEVPDLVFSQPMRTAEQVAESMLEMLDRRRQELDVPRLSGTLATLGYLSPRLFAALRAPLTRLGARNKARFATRRQSTPRTDIEEIQ
jgi:short-subunit dehydrogenase